MFRKDARSAEKKFMLRISLARAKSRQVILCAEKFNSLFCEI